MPIILRTLAFGFILLSSLSLHAANISAKPNIVVILTDDMGYSDLGCYGGEIRTPNLDKLAAGGVRYTQFYNTARCCPTRAALLTGLYPHQAGIGHMMEDRGVDGYRGNLNKHCVTIAQVLKPAGYKTYALGKWHVTPTGANGDRANWPLQRGFDRYYGTIAGAGNYYDPTALTRDNTPITAATDPDYRPKEFYYTDAITDNAVTFLADHAAKTPQDPFFMYVAYTAAHWPMHAPEDAIAEYKGFYDAGYEKFRADRLKKMKEIGLVPADQELTPPAGDWSKVANKPWELRCMEVYAAMVTRMDHGVGKIVDELRRTKKLDDTLILFMQDNGACAEDMGRVAALKAGTLPGPKESNLAYGENWANVSNTPFREYKHWTHEGGISTPLIAHWPARHPRAPSRKFESSARPLDRRDGDLHRFVEGRVSERTRQPSDQTVSRRKPGPIADRQFERAQKLVVLGT
ncbi:MAG: arylsulfatase [Pirellulales bacterium]